MFSAIEVNQRDETDKGRVHGASDFGTLLTHPSVESTTLLCFRRAVFGPVYALIHLQHLEPC